MQCCTAGQGWPCALPCRCCTVTAGVAPKGGFRRKIITWLDMVPRGSTEDISVRQLLRAIAHVISSPDDHPTPWPSWTPCVPEFKLPNNIFLTIIVPRARPWHRRLVTSRCLGRVRAVGPPFHAIHKTNVPTPAKRACPQINVRAIQFWMSALVSSLQALNSRFAKPAYHCITWQKCLASVGSQNGNP